MEETVTPFTPAGLLNQPPGQMVTSPSPPGKDEARRGNADLQKGSQRIPAENEEQHASKLHFFQGEVHCDARVCVCVLHSVEFMQLNFIFW